MEPRGKILITDYVHSYIIIELEDMGYSVSYDKDYKTESLSSDLPHLTGIVINSKIKMQKEQIDLAPNLKFIARLGAGLEIIDVEYASRKGIKVFNSPEGNRNAVGEHTLGMLLALANNLLIADAEVRRKEWNREKNRGFELEGKTIGIIGLGNTGAAFARKLSGWTLSVCYYDKYRLEIPDDLAYLKSVSLKDLLRKSDIISIHLPLTAETRGMVDDQFLKSCKNGMILINTSRGQIVNTRDLLKALKSGLIGGACLDVFENEKPFNFSSEENQLYNQLYQMKNVVLSPHIAGWTHESLLKIAQILVEKIKTVI